MESVDYETEASLDAQRHAGTLIDNNSDAVWPRLVSLVAHNFGFHEVNMLWLAFSQFPNLRSLDASGTAISPSNLQILTQAEWPELTKLRLRNISVSSYGLSNLDGVNEALSWTKLKCLDLSDAGSCKYFDDEVCTQLALAD